MIDKTIELTVNGAPRSANAEVRSSLADCAKATRGSCDSDNARAEVIAATSGVRRMAMLLVEYFRP